MTITDYIQITFSFLLVLATVVYVYFTYKLVQESRRSREMNLKPYLLAYFDSAETKPTLKFLNIQNVGNGPALNVRFKIIKDLEWGSKSDKSLNSLDFLNRNYTQFPPSFKFRNFITNMTDNIDLKMKSQIIIQCFYEDIFNKKYTETFTLNLSDGFGTGMLTPPETYIGLISYEIKKLNKTLAKVNDNLTTFEKLDKNKENKDS